MNGCCGRPARALVQLADNASLHSASAVTFAAVGCCQAALLSPDTIARPVDAPCSVTVNDPDTATASATVRVEPPAGVPFDTIVLTVCLAAPANTGCREFVCDPAINSLDACPVTALDPSTNYTVTGKAISGGGVVSTGGPDTFRTKDP